MQPTFLHFQPSPPIPPHFPPLSSISPPVPPIFLHFSAFPSAPPPPLPIWGACVERFVDLLAAPFPPIFLHFPPSPLPFPPDPPPISPITPRPPPLSQGRSGTFASAPQVKKPKPGPAKAGVWSTSLRREKVANCVVEVCPRALAGGREACLCFAAENAVPTITKCVIGTSLHPTNNFRRVAEFPCPHPPPQPCARLRFDATGLQRYVSISFESDLPHAFNTRVVFLSLTAAAPPAAEAALAGPGAPARGQRDPDARARAPQNARPPALPLCTACGLAIDGDLTKALSRTWHPRCFVCQVCGEAIRHGQFTLLHQKPLHLGCMHLVPAPAAAAAPGPDPSREPGPAEGGAPPQAAPSPPAAAAAAAADEAFVCAVRESLQGAAADELVFFKSELMRRLGAARARDADRGPLPGGLSLEDLRQQFEQLDVIQLDYDADFYLESSLRDGGSPAQHYEAVAPVPLPPSPGAGPSPRHWPGSPADRSPARQPSPPRPRAGAPASPAAPEGPARPPADGGRARGPPSPRGSPAGAARGPPEAGLLPGSGQRSPEVLALCIHPPLPVALDADGPADSAALFPAAPDSPAAAPSAAPPHEPVQQPPPQRKLVPPPRPDAAGTAGTDPADPMGWAGAPRAEAPEPPPAGSSRASSPAPAAPTHSRPDAPAASPPPPHWHARQQDARRAQQEHQAAMEELRVKRLSARPHGPPQDAPPCAAAPALWAPASAGTTAAGPALTSQSLRALEVQQTPARGVAGAHSPGGSRPMRLQDLEEASAGSPRTSADAASARPNGPSTAAPHGAAELFVGARAAAGPGRGGGPGSDPEDGDLRSHTEDRRALLQYLSPDPKPTCVAPADLSGDSGASGPLASSTTAYPCAAGEPPADPPVGPAPAGAAAAPPPSPPAVAGGLRQSPVQPSAGPPLQPAAPHDNPPPPPPAHAAALPSGLQHAPVTAAELSPSPLRAPPPSVASVAPAAGSGPPEEAWAGLRERLGPAPGAWPRALCYPVCNFGSLERVLAMAQYGLYLVTDAGLRAPGAGAGARRRAALRALDAALGTYVEEVATASCSLLRTVAGGGAGGGAKWIMLYCDEPQVPLCLRRRGGRSGQFQSGRRACEGGWGGRLLAVGDAVGAGVGVWGCLWAVSGGWRCSWGWCWGMGMPLGGYWRLEMRLGLVLGYGDAFGRLVAVGDAVGAGVGVWECLWAVTGGRRCGWGWCWGMGMPLGG